MTDTKNAHPGDHPGEPVAWVSPGQLAKLPADPEQGGAAYLPIRHTKNGNFTMPLYASPTSAPAGDGARREALRETLDDVRETFERIANAGFSENVLIHGLEAQGLVEAIDALSTQATDREKVLEEAAGTLEALAAGPNLGPHGDMYFKRAATELRALAQAPSEA